MPFKDFNKVVVGFFVEKYSRQIIIQSRISLYVLINVWKGSLRCATAEIVHLFTFSYACY